jgi:demethylmenaquinone methyltransferase/2-methoxy-6-polyprenyl-1,4-benzoquinol methylase
MPTPDPTPVQPQAAPNPQAAPERDPAKVRAMFGRVARRYRLANTILSGGMDALWRRRATAIVRTWQPERVLDLATGTGDLARAIEAACSGAHVIGADFSPQMLDVALGSKHLIEADALALPFPASEFDAVTVAFGLRNMASWECAVTEMARVTRPGGRLLVLDFSIPAGLLRWIYRPYLHLILPRLAGWITGEWEAYRYLARSIEVFPRGAALCDLITGAGWIEAQCEPLTGGVASLYTGKKA